MAKVESVALLARRTHSDEGGLVLELVVLGAQRLGVKLAPARLQSGLLLLCRHRRVRLLKSPLQEPGLSTASPPLRLEGSEPRVERRGARLRRRCSTPQHRHLLFGGPRRA